MTMDLDFWHERWQANLIGFHQDKINTHLQRYWPRLQLPADSRILVPLCGKSLDMLWLLEQGHPVVGVEVSQIAIENFFEEHRLSPGVHEERYGRRYVVEQLELLCADFFTLAQADIGPVDAFYDRAALIALTAAQRPRYAAQLTQLLGHGSGGLLVTLEYRQSEMSGPPFSVPGEEVQRLFDSAFTLEPLFRFDALEENQKFREKGLTQLTEHAWYLRRKGATAERG
ncbi:MAG: thiopurine S-methyltransferase [Gammaproteobacteria bacterium]